MCQLPTDGRETVWILISQLLMSCGLLKSKLKSLPCLKKILEQDERPCTPIKDQGHDNVTLGWDIIKEAFYSRNNINKGDYMFTIVLWGREMILLLAPHETDFNHCNRGHRFLVKGKFYNRAFRRKIIIFSVTLRSHKKKNQVTWLRALGNCCLKKEERGVGKDMV